MERKYRLVISFIILSMFLIGCEKKEVVEEREIIVNNPKIDKVQEFNFSEKYEITGLNPLKNNTFQDNNMHQIIAEGLVRNVTGENGKSMIKPGIAEDWDISQDGKTYTFYLREDALWSDGVALTSDDFVYTFRKMADGKEEATNAWLLDGVIKNFSNALYNEGINPDYDKRPEEIGVRAVDGNTLEIRLEKPNTSFLEILDKVRPVRQDRYEEWKDDYGRSIDKTLFTGQFVVKSWDKKESMTLVKNKNYWNEGSIKLRTINRYIIKNKSEEIERFLSGNLDVVDVLSSEDKSAIEKKNKDIQIINNKGIKSEFILMNTDNKYLNNDKVRLAISLAIDREEYMTRFKSKSDETLYSIIPSMVSMGERTYADRVDYKNNIIEDLEGLHKNPRKLLEEGIKESGAKFKPEDIELKYTVKKSDETKIEELNWMKATLKENLGIDLEIEERDFQDFLSILEKGSFDLIEVIWEPDFNDPYSILTVFNSEYGHLNRNITGWSGRMAEEYNKILKEASEVSDVNERAYRLLKAEKILLSEGIVAPIYAPSTNLYIKGYVKGYNRNLYTSVDFTDIYILGK